MSPHDRYALDVSCTFHGSIVLVRPLTDAAKTWIDENVQDDAQWYGGCLVVEPRCFDQLLHGMAVDGALEVG